MKKAMHNVEKSYAVVGVLEELNKTLTVLEHYVPRFFKGAKDLYYSKLNFCQNMICHNYAVQYGQSAGKSAYLGSILRI
jgi:hypothetical protein